MKDLFAQVIDMLIGRQYGPLSFRLIIQPLVGAAFGIWAGFDDARAGRPPYGWTVISRPDRRRHLLLEGWNHINRLFFASLIIDVVYEIIEFRWIYPIQPLIVATVLALPTYFLVRGLTNRIARWRLHDSHGPTSGV